MTSPFYHRQNRKCGRHLTESLKQEAQKVGLKINIDKTKIIKINRRTNANITIDCQSVGEVDRFCYLGSTLSNDGKVEADVNSRIGRASAVFQRMRPIWNTRKVDIKTKVRLYSTIVLPTAIYASETWKMTERIAKKLNVFHQQCLRSILKITYRDHVTNEEVLRLSASRKLQDIVTERRMPDMFANVHALDTTRWKMKARQVMRYVLGSFGKNFANC